MLLPNHSPEIAQRQIDGALKNVANYQRQRAIQVSTIVCV